MAKVGKTMDGTGKELHEGKVMSERTVFKFYIIETCNKWCGEDEDEVCYYIEDNGCLPINGWF